MIWCDASRAWPENSANTEFFERKIRPVLAEYCYECHSAASDLIQGGLRLDNASAMMRGGDSGDAVMPGRPGASLLIAAIRYNDLEMPPDQPLAADVVRDFEKWIRDGAAIPESVSSVDQPVDSLGPAKIDWQEARDHWAFQPLRRHEPESTLSDRADEKLRGQIDAFVLDSLRSADLTANPPAEKRTWIRRVTFDLIGLPPTPAEVHDFLHDDDPRADRRVVDRLLANPAFGERWARLWLDVSRYAEDQAHIVGDNDSLTYPNAYLYRDWVVDAFVRDMPYDEFVRTQLAGDLIAPGDLKSHVALGFLGLGPKYYRRGDIEVMADEWEDRVDVVSRGLLGLTVACARCHDHKYDPIPTSDYYALAGVFASTEMFNRPIDESVETKAGQATSPRDAVHVLREGTPRDLNIMIRGDANRLGPVVPRGFLSALKQPSSISADDFQDGSGRLALANRIINPDNPLTARVIVNRIWGELMGQPLVETTSNFGSLGAHPTHPKLLDDLAVRLIRSDWSLKWLVREIALSRTYQQSSQINSRNAEIDPSNRLRWRMPRRRLSLEAYRDAVLSVSGELDRSLFGPSESPEELTSRRRTVYSKVSRLDLNPMLALFDFPDPNAHSASRHETTTPLQKLFLLNSPFVLHHADRLSTRVISSSNSDSAAIRMAFQLCFGRSPTVNETMLARKFIGDGESSRYSELMQTLLISNEMFMVD